jgi:tetratricopeptide (TPR) repeat protein
MMSSLEERAESAERSGDFEGAFSLWCQLAAQTRDPMSFCRAGQAAEEAEKWIDAEDAYKRAIKLDPMFVEAMEGLGALFIGRTDGDSHLNFVQAKEWLLRALKINRHARLLTFLGDTYAGLDEREAAHEAFNEAILLDPTYEEAYFNLALLAEDQNPPEARRLLEKAVELNPNYGLAHQRLGIIFHKAGDLLQAEYLFRRCIEIEQEDYFSHLYLANTLAVQGRDGEAEQEFRAAISLRPTEPGAYKLFANFLDGDSRAKEATEIRARGRLAQRAARTQ